MSPRRACRKDANHDLIAEAFRKCGWSWIDTYQHAQYTPGFPDGLALRDGRVLWVEVKTPTGELTDDEMAFARRVIETGASYRVVRSVRDVERLSQAARSGG